jgi:calcineurin-like phosphoesterase family protein
MSDYVTSDWHFNHARVIQFERTRFATIEEHNEFIVSRYNKVIGPDDTCYMLGDVGMGGAEGLAHWVKKLNGHKILILGNHDNLSVRAYLDIGFESVHKGPLYYSENEGIGAPSGRIILSHEPVKEALDNPYVINVHGHLHNSELSLDRFFNVNVARTDYAPIPLHMFSKKTLTLTKSRDESFGHEWYSQYYKWDEGHEHSRDGEQTP